MSGPDPLPEKAADTTAEQPWPVRLLSLKIADYVEKMSVLWVEGQVVQLNRRPGARTAYLTLRDPDVDMSLSVVIQVNWVTKSTVGLSGKCIPPPSSSVFTSTSTLKSESILPSW